MKKLSYSLFFVLVIFSLMLSACKANTPVPAVETEEPKPVEPTATTAPAKPTETTAPEPSATVEPTATTEPKPLWGDVRVKQAIAAAIDREAIVDRVFEGRNTPAYGMVPPSYPGGSEPFLDEYGTRDLERAKTLLVDAGYTAEKPFTFDLFYPPDHYGTTTADVMQVIKQQLEETGLIKVNLQVQAWAQFIGESVPNGEFPANILGWFPDFADAETWVTPFGSCNQSPDQGVFYCDKMLDDMLASASSETDQAKRNTLFMQIGDYWAKNIPTLPLFWEPEYIVVRKGISGVAISSVFEFNYNILSFDQGYTPASGSMDTLIIGTTDALESLDPADAYATHDWEIIKNTGVSLLSYTPGTTELVPGLAADMPKISEDGKTYTFTLREGLKYADGTPLTSQDFVRMFARLSLGGNVASLLTNYIDKVEAPDPLTVVFSLKDAYAFFPALVATAPFVPANPAQFPDGELAKLPALVDGNGAYRMLSFSAGQQMVLEANPNYWGEDKAKIKTIIIKYFDKPTTMSQAVEKGEIDIAWRILGAVEAVRLQSIETVTVTKIDAPTLRYLVFNMGYMTGQ